MPLTKIDDRGLTTPVDLQDNEKIRLGTGNDLQIYHDGTRSWLANATGGLRLSVAGGSNRVDINKGTVDEHMAKFEADGSVELYYDNSKKFETISTGVQVTGEISHLAGTYTNASGGHVKIKHDSGKLTLGAGEDLELYHNGTNSTIRNVTGQLQLRSDSIALENNNGSDYATLTGIKFADNGKARFGTGNDLQIYHDGSHSYLKGSTGFTLVYGATGIALQPKEGEYSLYASADGETKLYYDNSTKLETTSTGNKITGQLEITGGSDEQLMLKGTTPFIRWYESGTQKAYAQWNTAGYLELHNHETSKGFRVGGQGVEVNDNIKFTAGDSQDLQMYHDGTNSQIRTSTGVLQIGGTTNPAHGCTQHGDNLFYQNDKGWSTTTYLAGHSHRHIRRHVHRLEHGQNNVATFDLLRYRKYWWGWGHIEIRLHANYYYGSQTVVAYLHGYSAGGSTNYAIRTLDQVYVNGTDHRPGGWSINLRTPSSSSPGSTDCNYVDVYAQIPNYTYGTVEVIAMSQYNESATSASMSTNSYTLFDF